MPQPPQPAPAPARAPGISRGAHAVAPSPSPSRPLCVRASRGSRQCFACLAVFRKCTQTPAATSDPASNPRDSPCAASLCRGGSLHRQDTSREGVTGDVNQASEQVHSRSQIERPGPSQQTGLFASFLCNKKTPLSERGARCVFGDIKRGHYSQLSA